MDSWYTWVFRAWVGNLKQRVTITSKFSNFKGETQFYVIKLPKSAGAGQECPKIMWVPGTCGTRTNSSPVIYRVNCKIDTGPHLQTVNFKICLVWKNFAVRNIESDCKMLSNMSNARFVLEMWVVVLWLFKLNALYIETFSDFNYYRKSNVINGSFLITWPGILSYISTSIIW